MTIKFTFNETLENNSNLNRNKIAVEGKIRPATLHDLAKGRSKSITFEVLKDILDTMNEIDASRDYDISDIFIYEKK